MENNITMKSKDTISAKEAQCYVTIGNERFLWIHAKNIETKIEKIKSEVSILGKRMTGHKTTGLKGTGKMTVYYVDSTLRKALERYKDTGEDLYFDIQVTNNDPTSSAGSQTILFINCNTDNGILSKFDSEGDTLDEDIDFTFEDFKIPETFNLLDGMK